MSKTQTKNTSNGIVKNDDASAIRKLFYCKYDKDGKVTEIKIKQYEFLQLLKSFGFFRYDIENDYFFIRIENNIVSKIELHQIQDYFFSHLDKLPEKINEDVSRKDLKEKFIAGQDTFFNKKKLSFLNAEKPFVFCNDTKDTIFLYFKNGYVEVTKKGYTLKNYQSLNSFVWKSQILPRDFKAIDIKENVSEFGVVAKYLFNIANQDLKRFESLCSITGYLIHSFFETKAKALILCDSTISDNAEGRTGKSIYGKMFQHIRSTAIIDGKSFEPTDKFKYQKVNIDTQIVFLNDMKRNLKLEHFYTDITDGMKVEQKNMKPFNVFVKMIFATNTTFNTRGASSKDRVLEFELSNYYSLHFSPEHEFGFWLFGTEKPLKEWHYFYNLMCYCSTFYLKNGIIQAPEINLSRKKLLEQTNEDFINFMDDLVKNKNIVSDTKYCKKDLHQQFLESYPDHSNRGKWLNEQKNFTKYLIYYIELSGYFGKFDKNIHEVRSNGKDYIIFPKPLN